MEIVTWLKSEDEKTFIFPAANLDKVKNKPKSNMAKNMLRQGR